MNAALAVAGLAVAVADLWLVISCWRSCSVLPGILGATGIPIALLCVAPGPARNQREAALVIAAITLVVGVALYGIGQLIQRLLDREPDDER